MPFRRVQLRVRPVAKLATEKLAFLIHRACFIQNAIDRARKPVGIEETDFAASRRCIPFLAWAMTTPRSWSRRSSARCSFSSVTGSTPRPRDLHRAINSACANTERFLAKSLTRFLICSQLSGIGSRICLRWSLAVMMFTIFKRSSAMLSFAQSSGCRTCAGTRRYGDRFPAARFHRDGSAAFRRPIC